MKTLLDWDRWIQKYVNLDLSNPYNDILMKLWSAEWPWVLIIVAFALQILWRRQWHRLFHLFWLGATIGLADFLAHFVVKPWVGRVRPCRFGGLVRIVDGCAGYFSFPSNHAANAAVFCVLWFFLFSRVQGVLAVLCAFIIGFSRVYLGVHYPTDILGGFIFGTLLGLVSYMIWRRLPLGTKGRS